MPRRRSRSPTVDAWIADHPDALDEVTFVLFSADTLEAFERARWPDDGAKRIAGRSSTGGRSTGRCSRASSCSSECERTPTEVVEYLVGLQAQEPPDPYVALWTRIDGFDPTELSALIEGRLAVRMGLLRGTLHLVTADDALAQYPILADVMRRSWRSSPFIKQLDGVDVEAVDRGRRGPSSRSGR